ncbi:unnamed protein product, partial [Staurois parvus]
RNETVALDVCFGSLLCWKTSSFNTEQYICEFMIQSMKCSYLTPAALPPPCIFLCTSTFVTPYSFEAIHSKNIYLALITPEY